MALYPVISDKTTIGRIATFQQESRTGGSNALSDANLSEEKITADSKSLAHTLQPKGGKPTMINVVSDYSWTLSDVNSTSLHDEIPYIELIEYKCAEASIQKQMNFYAHLTYQSATNSTSNQTIITAAKKSNDFFAGSKGPPDTLDPYKDIWPTKNPTNFTYRFPYFNKTSFELSTDPWTTIGSAGEAVKQGIEAFSKLGDTAKSIGTALKGVASLVDTGMDVKMNLNYPSVGIQDRPKMFGAHADRSINISVTLYNTVKPGDWKDNRSLIYLLMSQNLFNKRDYITGVPPVFYQITIPGQYFCWAASVTNIKVENLGNQRLLEGNIVPDAYQLEITLTELVKPSKNQFERVANGGDGNIVTASLWRDPSLNATFTNNFGSPTSLNPSNPNNITPTIGGFNTSLQ